ncbi:hypothetical protein OTK49_00775 [Vibrio coralliirubri]|uniref:hypothetical protein n=1 Tax=Vibrio coralliirubri TaxID=1516159 RepID=UPI00228444E1|nr:hypothetical protein [Vibrio coralliirubri]MCY9861064.1 hypothetical protein [Vibrio coralliirubri]
MILEYQIACVAIYFIVLHPLLSLLIQGREKYGKSPEYSVIFSIFVFLFWVFAWWVTVAEKHRVLDYIESEFKVPFTFGYFFTGFGVEDVYIITWVFLISACLVVPLISMVKPKEGRIKPATLVVQPFLAIVVALTTLVSSPNSNSAYYKLDLTLSESMLQVLKAACPDSQSVSYVSNYRNNSEDSYIDSELHCNSGIDRNPSSRGYLSFHDFKPIELGAYHPSSSSQWDLVIGFKDNKYVPLIRFDSDNVPPVGTVSGYTAAASKMADALNKEFIRRNPQIISRLSIQNKGDDYEWESIRVM